MGHFQPCEISVEFWGLGFILAQPVCFRHLWNEQQADGISLFLSFSVSQINKIIKILNIGSNIYFSIRWLVIWSVFWSFCNTLSSNWTSNYKWSLEYLYLFCSQILTKNWIKMLNYQSPSPFDFNQSDFPTFSLVISTWLILFNSLLKFKCPSVLLV